MNPVSPCRRAGDDVRIAVAVEVPDRDGPSHLLPDLVCRAVVPQRPGSRGGNHHRIADREQFGRERNVETAAGQVQRIVQGERRAARVDRGRVFHVEDAILAVHDADRAAGLCPKESVVAPLEVELEGSGGVGPREKDLLRQPQITRGVADLDVGAGVPDPDGRRLERPSDWRDVGVRIRQGPGEVRPFGGDSNATGAVERRGERAIVFVSGIRLVNAPGPGRDRDVSRSLPPARLEHDLHSAAGGNRE